MYHEFDINKAIWLKTVKNILIKCGLSGFSELQKTDGPFWFIKSIKQKLKDVFINEWFAQVESSPSTLNYRIFKTKFEQEHFLQKLPFKMKKNLFIQDAKS